MQHQIPAAMAHPFALSALSQRRMYNQPNAAANILQQQHTLAWALTAALPQQAISTSSQRGDNGGLVISNDNARVMPQPETQNESRDEGEAMPAVSPRAATLNNI